MAAIMLIVAVSRGLVVPVYLTELGQLNLAPGTMAWLQMASFAFLALALCTGGIIIIASMLRGHRQGAMTLREPAPD
jgi:hypothetical protein